ncbi:MAG: sigma-70 family RNA polymerase sigma factor [Pyrinomonadaceae bacterium]|nr:sigma-70 family RNA polymerase sigma factor [Pyrinomonadaceae bacterium]
MQRLGEADAESKSPDLQPSASTRRKWTLTQEAFDKLLDALGPDRERAGEIYLEIRNNLVRFFEWRGAPLPEDHADETFNRLAKRVAGGEEILNPMSYCLGVARLLLLEINKERVKEQQALSEMTTSQALHEAVDDGAEARLECLRSCLETLSPDNRELIVQYYQGEKGAKIENRKKLVERLGIPVNTLRMRALRLRERLQACVEDCLKN